MTTVITIPQEVVNHIQALGVETESRKDLIAYMLSSNLSTATEQFATYQAEYKEFYRQFDLAKTNLEKDYIRTVIENPIRWELDYNSCEVTIYY